MEWTNDFTIKFLEFYQSEPCLWDPSDENHKRKEKLADAWNRISESTGKSVAELKKKKDSLMATFRGHLRRKKASIRSGAGGDDIYKPIWFAYSFMETFLGQIYDCHPTINSQDTISLDNETLEPTSQESESEINEVVNVVPSAKSQQAALVAKPHRPTPLPISQQRYRRRQVPTELLQAESEMKEAFSWVKNVVSRNDEKEDECDLYGRMLAKKLRKIPEFQREYLMHDINEMVLRAMHPSHGSVATPSCSNGPPSNSSLISLSYSRSTSANSNNCSYASSQGINEHAQDQMEEHIQESDPISQALYMTFGGKTDTNSKITHFNM
ncbi:unnamed protein product [Acanthoscelides obtectus]|uniref:MADF domain-containing protein n=1 Tax=Acanthoscelides obtectus TaxID=200917 RepID=A0A9P0KMQ4_ACAOB|nr:unnamed protein product [Acanthoscelides obtectus]CAK1667676.1 hypothetical protein AOBTE_LOCUS25982 [Acanthoscelides obtectus]